MSTQTAAIGNPTAVESLRILDDFLPGVPTLNLPGIWEDEDELAPEPAQVPTTATPPTAPAVNPSPNIIDQIAAFSKRFVFLTEPSLYRLLALWVIHTYLIKHFSHTGYVFVHSPEPQSGKTRLLEVLNVLVYHSSQILTSPTEAVLFHTAHQNTQLLDEVDTWTNRDCLIGILNSGHNRTGVVVRMEKNDKGNYEPLSRPVFGARALSGIGTHILPDSTKSRTFAFSMVRQTRGERREKFRERVVRPEAKRLVEQINGWVKDNESAIEEWYGREGFAYLDKFSDRTIDICEPLAAILEVAYRGSPELNSVRLSFLQSVSITRAENTELTRNHQIIVALASIAETEDPLIATPSDLAERCSRLGVRCSEYDVSSTIRAYGFTTKSARKGDEVKKCYSLSHASLTDILSRYLCGNDEVVSSPVTTEPTTPQLVGKVAG